MTPDQELPPEFLKHLIDTEGVEKTLRLYTERYNAITARKSAEFDAHRTNHEAVIKFAVLAINSLLILCGGAAIAVLSFAGSQAQSGQASLDAYAFAVQLFGGSAAGAVMTAGVSYISQSCFGSEVQWVYSAGNRLRFAAVAIWFISLIAFASGVMSAANSVSSSKAVNPPPDVSCAVSREAQLTNSPWQR